MTDQDRERLIEAWRVVIELAPNSYKQMAAAQMKAEINRRTQEQVQKMERERGLRAS